MQASKDDGCQGSVSGESHYVTDKDTGEAVESNNGKLWRRRVLIVRKWRGTSSRVVFPAWRDGHDFGMRYI